LSPARLQDVSLVSLTVPLPARSESVQGILAMLAAMAIFVVNDTLVKITTATLPKGETIFVRGVFITTVCWMLIARSGQAAILSPIMSPLVLARGLADLGSTTFFISALVHMPIGDIFGVLQFTPLAITAGAALFLGAKVGWRRWTATCVGLVGVLIIIRPGASTFNPYASFAILSILCSVARDLLTRRLAATVPPFVIVGTSAALVTVASTGFAAFETWIWPWPAAVLMLFVASLALLAGQYWLVIAMRTGEIAVVAPFRYSIILWAVLAGFAVWGEIPDAPTWLGIAIVSGAGLYTFMREYQLAKAARP
jgi:drug/metabolite transporter (DMT)-like permease